MAYCRHSRGSGNLGHKQTLAEIFLGVAILKSCCKYLIYLPKKILNSLN